MTDFTVTFVEDLSLGLCRNCRRWPATIEYTRRGTRSVWCAPCFQDFLADALGTLRVLLEAYDDGQTPTGEVRGRASGGVPDVPPESGEKVSCKQRQTTIEQKTEEGKQQ